MSGITGAINTALSGLQLFEAGIATVSNNLANESTPGYAVENVNALTSVGSPGQPGTGVEPPQILRAAAGFAAALLRGANSAAAAAAAQSASLTTLSNALTNNGDVQTSINQFFEDISTLAANPTSAGQRQTVLADAQSVVSTFQSAAGTINGSISASSTTLNQSVASANNLLGQLAALNKSLRLAPNEPGLLDQQQAALNSLSSLIPINALPQANGAVILATGGTILLDQSGAQNLSVVNNAAGTPTVTAGNDATPVTTTESDGAIGSAIASFQAGTAALTGLNAFAAVFANSVNTAQAEGLTPSGAPGGALFSVPAPAVTASTGNTGTAVVTATLTNPALLPADGGPFTLTYSSTTGWSALDQASGQTTTAAGTPPTLLGLTLNITGAPANGDSYTLSPAPNAATGIAVAATSPNDIAAADPYVATPGTLQSDGSILNKNGGTLTAGTDTVTSTPTAGATVIPASYFGQNLQITFTSPTAYTVSTSAAPGTAIATGTLASSGSNIAVAYPAGAAAGKYWQLPVTGTPTTGDSLTLTQGGVNSGSNASRLGALFSAANTTTSGTLQQAIITLGTGLGANALQAQLTATAATSQVTTATTNLQTVAGVNTDQQAVTLTNYQQAYQAAAQAISAAHTAFESLLQSV
jgi:flagellar hook-associated protein 1 FlgK